MKTSTAIVLGASAILVAFVVASGGSAQDQAKVNGAALQTWEYTQINFWAKRRDGKDLGGDPSKPTNDVELLNQLGTEGWELVGIDPTYWDTSHLAAKPGTDPYRVVPAYGATFYFKRPKRSK